MEPREQAGNILLDVLKAKCADAGLDVRDPKFTMELDHAMREVEFVFVIPVSYESIREANLNGDK